MTRGVIFQRGHYLMLHRLLDYCNKRNALMPGRQHYTGSKAEGLDLPDSDDDYAQDINDLYNVKVVQSLSEISDTPIFEEFLLCTDTESRICFFGTCSPAHRNTVAYVKSCH